MIQKTRSPKERAQNTKAVNGGKNSAKWNRLICLYKLQWLCGGADLIEIFGGKADFIRPVYGKRV